MTSLRAAFFKTRTPAVPKAQSPPKAKPAASVISPSPDKSATARSKGAKSKEGKKQEALLYDDVPTQPDEPKEEQKQAAPPEVDPPFEPLFPVESTQGEEQREEARGQNQGMDEEEDDDDQNSFMSKVSEGLRMEAERLIEGQASVRMEEEEEEDAKSAEEDTPVVAVPIASLIAAAAPPPSPVKAPHKNSSDRVVAKKPRKRPLGAKRHRKVLRDNIQGITKPAIRRLARRGGVKRMSGAIYEEIRGVLKVFLEQLIRDAVVYTEHAQRKTVTAMDVVYALKRQGRTLYGYGG